jgi:Spy/CpxP family protein refolding chaperone
MDIFAQNKLLIRLVLFLVLLNLFSIGLFLWKGVGHRPGPPPGFRDVTEVLRRELNLTEQQAQQVNDLRITYFEKEKLVLDQLRAERDSMNNEMFNVNTDDSLMKTLAKNISENEYRMEMLRYEQSKELKAICSPDQLAKFAKLVGEIRDYFHPGHHPPGK